MLQGRNEGRQKGHNALVDKTLGAPKSPNNVIILSSIQHICSYKDIGFEHGGAKLVSCPGRNLTSVHPRDAVMPNVLFSPLQDTMIFSRHFRRQFTLVTRFDNDRCSNLCQAMEMKKKI